MRRGVANRRHGSLAPAGTLLIAVGQRHFFLAERGRAGISVEYLGERADEESVVEPWQGWNSDGNRHVGRASAHA